MFQAVDDDTDDRFTWLARPRRKPVERWQKSPVYDVLLTGEFKANKEADVLELSLLVFDQQMAEPVQVVKTEIKPSDATVSANLPINLSHRSAAGRLARVSVRPQPLKLSSTPDASALDCTTGDGVWDPMKRCCQVT